MGSVCFYQFLDDLSKNYILDNMLVYEFSIFFICKYQFQKGWKRGWREREREREIVNIIKMSHKYNSHGYSNKREESRIYQYTEDNFLSVRLMSVIDMLLFPLQLIQSFFEIQSLPPIAFPFFCLYCLNKSTSMHMYPFYAINSSNWNLILLLKSILYVCILYMFTIFSYFHKHLYVLSFIIPFHCFVFKQRTYVHCIEIL